MNKDDMLNRPFDAPLAYRWLISIGAGVAALVLFLVTAGRFVMPGPSAKHMAWHLGLDPFPSLLDFLWGVLIRECAGLPGDNTALWAGLLSVVCGAVCIFLLTSLMMRVRYKVHDEYDEHELRREHQARRIAGFAAGAFLTLSIPFWFASTRALPATFHLLMLLVVVWLFSEYQRTGKPVYLYSMAFLYGIGITEFATFWIFAPLAALLVVRAMLQRAEFSWPVLIRTGLCGLPGLFLYVVNAWVLWGNPAIKLRGFRSMWSIVWYTWRDQWHLIARAPHTTGFLIVMALVILPWCALFLLRGKKPAWRYSYWQVFLRLAVLAVAMAVLFNAPLTPWRFFGLGYLMLTPYLILAGCAGYVIGELWVMGQSREHKNAGIGQPLRIIMSIIAAACAIACLGAGFLHYPIVQTRGGVAVGRLVDESLADLDGQNVLLSAGILDDVIRICAKDRGMKLTVISVGLADVEQYREYLAERFTSPRQQALLQVGFGAFIQDYLAEDANLAKTAALDIGDFLREYGYVVPRGLFYTAVPTKDRANLPTLLDRERAFWAQMETFAQHTSAPENTSYGYEKYVLRVASKMINNIGFNQVDSGGDKQSAQEWFHLARRINPDNISALLNLLTIAQESDSPDFAEYDAEWKKTAERLTNRDMWQLSSLHGYVYNTGLLVRNGLMWAISGKPKMAEAEMRRASGGQAVSPEVKAFLARAYLQSGDVEQGQAYYREAVEANPKDIQSLVMLAKIAIRSEQYDEAESYLKQAEDAGVPPERLAFERIMIRYMRGQVDQAVADLKALVQAEKSNVQALALLALLTSNGRDKETYDRTVKTLRNMRGSSPEIRLLVAELLMEQRDWTGARNELEQVTRMNPRLVPAWEMLVHVDFQERKKDLAEDHVRILLTLDPNNYTGNLMLGSFQYSRNQYSLAESSYRTALRARREPVVMNDLAYLLMLKNDLGEAESLIDEALVRQPDNPLFLSTRSEIYLRAGRLDDAQRDLVKVLAVMPDHPQAILLAAEIYAARGQTASALALAEKLEPRINEFPAEQQERLKTLLKQWRSGASE